MPTRFLSYTLGKNINRPIINIQLDVPAKVNKKISFLLWMATLPAILGQLYMIHMFGGISGYVVAAKWGTKYFHGLGPLKTLIATYSPISLLFFAIIMNFRCSRYLKLFQSTLLYSFL